MASPQKDMLELVAKGLLKFLDKFDCGRVLGIILRHFMRNGRYGQFVDWVQVSSTGMMRPPLQSCCIVDVKRHCMIQ